MKLLFLHSISAGSGANTHLQEFLAAARDLGAEIRTVGQATEAVRVGGRHVRLPIPQACKDLVYLANNRSYRRRALDAAQAWRPDGIYFRGAPYMAYGRQVADELDLPLLYELNAPYPDEHIEYHGGTFGGIARRLEAANRASARRIFAVSRQLADILTADGVPGSKITVVPNGLRLEEFDPAPRADDGAVRFGFVGSLQVWHGVEVILAAFARVLEEVPSAHLHIVGAGRLDDWLAKEIAASPHTGRLHRHGALPKAEIPAFLAGMDVLLAPYPDLPRFYFSPLKLFEYLGSGRAIVASRVGQIADVLTDGRDGRLLPPGDAAALAACCIDLAVDAEARASLGQQARQTAGRHTWSANARTILAEAEAAVREARQ